MQSPTIEAEGKKEKRGQFSSNRTNAFQLFAQRNLTKIGVVEFKDCLDRFLASLPDEPKIGGAMPLNAEKSNSIIHQVTRGRWGSVDPTGDELSL